MTRAQLVIARAAGREAGTAGRPATECPYPASRELERHVWLRWHTWATLTAAGWPA